MQWSSCEKCVLICRDQGGLDSQPTGSKYPIIRYLGFGEISVQVLGKYTIIGPLGQEDDPQKMARGLRFRLPPKA